jgi:NAD(P)-dependent dehydrogenase (short-subunit alcohol dehydrogenase family)
VAVAIDLSGRTALVTGAAAGIGRATAELLATAGAAVVVADLDRQAGTAVARGIEDADGRAIAVRLDVRQEESARKAVRAAGDAFGPVHVLVNNAAVWTVKAFDEMTLEDYRRDLDVGLVGTMVVTRAVLDGMKDAGYGRIVNLASDAGRIGEPFITAYSAAKAGVIGFTKALAKEVGRHGITVNAIAPGTTKTPGSQALIERWGGEERLARGYPLRRLGEPIDQANAILFLCSDLAGWITGQVLGVDGGYATVG